MRSARVGGAPRLEADETYLAMFRSFFEPVGDPPVLVVSRSSVRAMAQNCAERGIKASDAAIRAHIHRTGIRMYHRRPTADRANEQRRLKQIHLACSQTPTRLFVAVFDQSTDEGWTWKPCSGRQVNRTQLTEWATAWIRRSCYLSDVLVCEPAIDFVENARISRRGRLGPDDFQPIWITMPSTPHFWGRSRELPNIGTQVFNGTLVRLTLFQPAMIEMNSFARQSHEH